MATIQQLNQDIVNTEILIGKWTARLQADDLPSLMGWQTENYTYIECCTVLESLEDELLVLKSELDNLLGGVM